MFRKTVLTTAVVGAGLVSTAGMAFAGDAPSGEHHGSGHSKTVNNTTDNTCVNNAGGSVHNGGAKAFGGVNGSQGALQGNILCDVLENNGNGNGSGNTISFGGSELPGLPELPIELPGDVSSTPEAPVQDAEPAEQAAPAQAAPTSSVPAGTTTTPIA